MLSAHVITVSLCLLWSLIPPLCATPVQSGSSEVNVKEASRQLVKDVRTLTAQAKNVSECETNSVIKMAATGSGSHETLTLLLADGALGVFSGRLSLSLSFLGRLAQQLEDQLALSSDVGPNLAAMVFGSKATASIAHQAINDDQNNNDNDVAEVSLGNGWTLVPESGLHWKSSNGHVSFKAATTTTKPFSILLEPSYSQSDGFAASLDFQHQFNNVQWNVGGSYSDSSGWGVSVVITIRF